MVRKKITKINKRHSQIIRRRSKNGGAQFELLIKKTGQHMYAMLLDLNNNLTLTTVSTISVFKKMPEYSRMQATLVVGKEIAGYCKKNNIVPAVNIADHRFHGLVKELVDSFSNNLKN